MDLCQARPIRELLVQIVSLSLLGNSMGISNRLAYKGPVFLTRPLNRLTLYYVDQRIFLTIYSLSPWAFRFDRLAGQIKHPWTSWTEVETPGR